MMDKFQIKVFDKAHRHLATLERQANAQAVRLLKSDINRAHYATWTLADPRSIRVYLCRIDGTTVDSKTLTDERGKRYDHRGEPFKRPGNWRLPGEKTRHKQGQSRKRAPSKRVPNGPVATAEQGGDFSW